MSTLPRNSRPFDANSAVHPVHSIAPQYHVFTIRSPLAVARFEWHNSQYLTFSPAIGHLAPREIKTVTVAFVANEAINFEKVVRRRRRNRRLPVCLWRLRGFGYTVLNWQLAARNARMCPTFTTNAHVPFLRPENTTKPMNRSCIEIFRSCYISLLLVFKAFWRHVERMILSLFDVESDCVICITICGLFRS